MKIQFKPKREQYMHSYVAELSTETEQRSVEVIRAYQSAWFVCYAVNGKAVVMGFATMYVSLHEAKSKARQFLRTGVITEQRQCDGVQVVGLAYPRNEKQMQFRSINSTLRTERQY